MLVNKKKLRKIIKEELIREAIFGYEIKPGKDYTVKLENQLENTKHVVRALTGVIKKHGHNVVGVIYDGRADPKSIFGNKLRRDELYFLADKGSGSIKERTILNTSWLTKNYLKERFGSSSAEIAGRATEINKIKKKLSKAWDAGKIGVIDPKFLVDDAEQRIEDTDNAVAEFLTDTGIGAIATLSELGSLIPGFQFLKGVSDSANLADMLIKMGRQDWLGVGFALAGLIPAVGDVLGVVGNAFNKMGDIGITPEIQKKLLDILSGLIDGELQGKLQDLIKWFASKSDGEYFESEISEGVEKAFKRFRKKLQRNIDKKENLKEIRKIKMTKKMILEIIKESMFTSDKDVKPNTPTRYAGSKADVWVLSKSFKEKLSKEYYVLVRWMGDKSPTKVFKNLPKKAWNRDVFGIFHDGSYDANHKEKLINQNWLSKQAGKKFSENYISKLKKDWDDNKIAAVSTKFLQSDAEFKKATAAGGTLEDFALDTAVPAVAAIAELGALVPGLQVLKGVSDGANIVDAMRKLSKNDYLGCGLALIGLIPAVGDSISIIGNGIKKVGAAAASRVAGATVVKELVEILGKIIDGDLIDSLKEVVYSFAEDRKIKPENTFVNIKNALATFKGSLEASIGTEKDASQAIAHAAGITKKKK